MTAFWWCRRAVYGELLNDSRVLDLVNYSPRRLLSFFWPVTASFMYSPPSPTCTISVLTSWKYMLLHIRCAADRLPRDLSLLHYPLFSLFRLHAPSLTYPHAFTSL